MGLYDRGYTQAGSDPGDGGHLGRFMRQPMTTRIVIVTVVVYLIDNLIMDNAITGALKLVPDAILNPLKIWKLVSVALTHASLAEKPLHIVFNMWMLWMFGRIVEQKYGSREFLALYVALAAGSSLVWCLCALLQGDPTPAVGASGAISGLIVIFALSYPHQRLRLIFPPIALPAWLMGAIIVGMDALGTIGVGSRGENIAYTAHLGGALFGAIYFFSRIRLTGGSHQAGYAGSSSYGGGGVYGQSYGNSGSSSGGWKFPKLPSFKKARLKVYDPEKRDAELDRRADAILEKVHNQGADSLTAKERKILDDYSRRVREKR